MENYKKILSFGVLVIMVFPSITFAAWWNPFTWNIFQKKESVLVTESISQENVSDIGQDNTGNQTLKNDSTGYGEVQKSANSFSDEKTVEQVPVQTNIPVLSLAPVETCRPETKIIDPPPYQISEDMRGYFTNVIKSNASMQDLEDIRWSLIFYREQVISNPDQFDSIDEGSHYSPRQLASLRESSQNLYNSIINYYYGWIIAIDKIIDDKKDNGCINGRDLYDYMN